MRTRRPTPEREDYLRAMYVLHERKVPLLLMNIAKYLSLSKSTVSERIQGLAREGFVKHQRYGELSFTTKGKKYAHTLTMKHRLIEVFLHEFLHIPAHRVHEEAHALEHGMSDLVMKRLAVFLNNPKTDPHGKHISL